MHIRLSMIVRNEAHTIERCLRSCVGVVDSACIVDTGSTDDTIAVIRRVAEDIGFPVAIHELPWVDFGTTRTAALELAQLDLPPANRTWVLLLDADNELAIDEHGYWVEQMYADEHDAFMVRYEGDPSYWLTRVIRADRKWRYVGRTHEYLTDIDERATTGIGRLDGMTIIDHADGGCRGEKFERDERLLRESIIDDPVNPRWPFYLAQTLRDLGRWDEAADWYERRADMGGWNEERYVAFLEAGRCMMRTGRHRYADAILAWMRAVDVRPERTEARYELAAAFRNEGRYNVAFDWAWSWARPDGMAPPPSDVLFVERWIYEWGLTFEASIAAWHIGRRDLSESLTRNLLDHPGLPPAYREAAESNLALSVAIDAAPVG